MRLKLADFGLALHLKNPNNPEEDEFRHQRWCAPEYLGTVLVIGSLHKPQTFSRVCLRLKRQFFKRCVCRWKRDCY